MINKHWARWIRASCRKHFDAYKGSYTLYVDGMDRDALRNLKAHAEFRIDGPRVYTQNGEYRLDVVINILVQWKNDESDLDGLVKVAGQFMAGFTPTINVYKFGSGPDDDRTALLGCLAEVEGVRLNNFGMIDETLKLEQGTIEGRYRIYL